MKQALDKIEHLEDDTVLEDLQFRAASGDALEVRLLREWLDTASPALVTRAWAFGGMKNLVANLRFYPSDPFEATGERLRATLGCLIVMADRMDMLSMSCKIPGLRCALVLSCLKWDDVRVKVAAVSLLRWAIEEFPGAGALVQLLELPFQDGFDLLRRMLRNRLCNGEALQLISSLLESPKLPRGRYSLEILHWRQSAGECLLNFVAFTDRETMSPSLAEAVTRFQNAAFEALLLTAYRQQITRDPHNSLSLLHSVHRALWPQQRRPKQLMRWRALMCSQAPLVNLAAYGTLGTDCFVYWCSVFRSQVLALMRSQLICMTKGSSFFWIDYAFSRLLRVALQCTLLRTPKISMPWLITGDDSFYRIVCFTVPFFLRCLESTTSFEDAIEAVQEKALLVVDSHPKSPEEFLDRMLQHSLDSSRSDDSTSVFGGSGSETWTDSERDDNFAAPQPPHVRYYRLSRFFGAAVPRGGSGANTIAPHFNPMTRNLRLARFFGARPMAPVEENAEAPAVGPQPQHVRQHRLQKLLGEDLPPSLWNNEPAEQRAIPADADEMPSWSSEEEDIDQAVEEFSATTMTPRSTWEDFSADSDATADSQLKRWDSFTILY